MPVATWATSTACVSRVRKVVVDRCDVHLALAREAAPRTRVLDAVEIALEAQPEFVGWLGSQPVAGATGARRAGREPRIEVGLALLPPPQRRTDDRVRICVRVPYDKVVDEKTVDGKVLDEFAHALSVTVGCDIDTPHPTSRRGRFRGDCDIRLVRVNRMRRRSSRRTVVSLNSRKGGVHVREQDLEIDLEPITRTEAPLSSGTLRRQV